MTSNPIHIRAILNPAHITGAQKSTVKLVCYRTFHAIQIPLEYGVSDDATAWLNRHGIAISSVRMNDQYEPLFTVCSASLATLATLFA